MPLDRRPIDFAFGGLQTKLAQQLVQPGSMLSLKDCEFAEPMALNKRNGHTALTTTVIGGTSIAAGAALFSLAGKLLLADGRYLYAYSSGGWIKLGDCLQGTVVEQTFDLPIPLQYGIAGQPDDTVVRYNDMAVLNGVAMIGGLTTADRYIIGLFDAATGAPIMTTYGGTTDSNDNPVRVFSTGTYLVFASAADAPAGASTIGAACLNPTTRAYDYTPTISGANCVTTNYSFDVVWDAVRAVGYCAHQTATGYQITRWTPAGGVLTTRTITCTPASPPCLVVGTNYIGVAYVRAVGALHYAVGRLLNPTTLADVGAADLGELDTFVPSTMFGAPSGYELTAATNTFHWWFPLLFADTVALYRTVSFVQTPTTGTSLGVTLQGLVPATRPFQYPDASGRWYAWCHYSKLLSVTGTIGEQESYFLVELNNLAVSAIYVKSRAFYGTAQDAAAFYTGFTRLQPANTFWYGSKHHAALIAQPAGANSFMMPCLATLDPTAPIRAVEKDGLVTLTGLQTLNCDGQTVWPANTYLWPEFTLASGAVVGGLADGTYWVRIVYAIVDARGRIDYSWPSAAKSITTAGGSSEIQVTTQGYAIDSDRLLRTFVYASIDNISYYLVASALVPGTTDFQAISAAAEKLYIFGGVLENAAPPCLTDIIVRGERLFGITPKGLLCYTKEIAAGELPSWNADYLSKQIHHDGGCYYQLADMDGRLFVVGTNSIRWLTGEGLNSTGSSDTLSKPEIIPTGKGIVSGSPVGVGEEGIWLKTIDGIRVLGRSLALESIGQGVDDYAAKVATAIVRIPKRNQVRIGHSDGLTLVYDTVAKAWSESTAPSHVSAAAYNGEHALLKSNGVIWVQGASVWTDAGAAVGRTIETPWLRLSALAGVQRLYWVAVVGEYRSAVSLVLSLYFDHAQTASETVTYAKTTGTTGDQIVFRHHSGRRCSAVKFKIVDTSAGEGCSLSGLTIEVAGKGGVFRYPSAQTV